MTDEKNRALDLVKENPIQKEMLPGQIVRELDKYIIGQKEAKKAVAIALRNRTRRRHVKDEIREEISPKNIIMIGATGVGKTEIARRMARLADAPFIKVEATKFTEVGYVGRDVESIIRDLVNQAVNEEKSLSQALMGKEAEQMTEEKILDSLLPSNRSTPQSASLSSSLSTSMGVPRSPSGEMSEESMRKTREKMRSRLRKGDFNDKYIDVEVNQPPHKNAFIEFMPEQGFEQIDSMMKNIIGQFSKGNKTKKMKVEDARKILKSQFIEKLIDMDKVVQKAFEKTENMGIVFIDEIDKIATRDGAKGIDVSREGVQRDILPLVEGCSVNTRYGVVKTDHILFIASGAFHMSSPSDLIPELQGRFPIRVELQALDAKDLEKILTKPKNALIRQYTALLQTENIELTFESSAVSEIARIASEINKSTFNIGARRLSTVMEKLLENILFDAPNVASKITIDSKYVRERLENIEKNKDLTKYIL